MLANFFFTSAGKQSFFLAINFRQFYCRMLPLLCTLTFGVFSGQHIFHQFRQQTWFFFPHFQQTFFSGFCGDKLFISIFFYFSVLDAL